MRKILKFFLLLKCFEFCVSFCVFDNKKGWWLDCGLRDSYLFRIKDLGGIQANFDVGIGFGDEKGFPNSISKTNHKGKKISNYLPPPSTFLPGYKPSHSGYKRKKDNGILNRRNDFPYKYESPPPPPPPRIPYPNSEIGNTVALKPSHSQPPSYYKPSYEKPIQKQEVQYIQHQRESQNQKYNEKFNEKPPYIPPQNQHHHYYNQIQAQSVDQKPQGSLRTWSLQKPQQVVTRRSQGPSSRYSFIPPTKKFNSRAYDSNSAQGYNPSGLLVPPPPQPPTQSSYHNYHQRQDNGFFRQGFQKPFVFHVPTTTTPPPPTVGPAMSELLNVPSHLSANSDNVPSFAAKMFVVREAPYEYYPPNYEGYDPRRPKINVQIPRTKFYCEEQKYLPGIYADAMLGCKVFHLCVPSNVGSTLTSYMCPNGTLFDQSILQCNFWYNVDCESSINDYDANLALALSYRRINAAHMSLQAATNTGTLSLLSQNIDHLQVSNPKNSISKRMGKMLNENEIDLNSKTIPKKSDDKVLYIGVTRSVNKTDINKIISNNSISNTSSIPMSNKSNNLNKDNLDPSQSILKDLVIQVQNQSKMKKELELNQRSKNLYLANTNNLGQSPYSAWTPLYKDETDQLSYIDINDLNI